MDLGKVRDSHSYSTVWKGQQWCRGSSGAEGMPGEGKKGQGAYCRRGHQGRSGVPHCH